MSANPSTRRFHPTQPASFEEALAQDTHPVPEVRHRTGVQDIGPLEIPTAWYLDRSIHELEIERLWKRVWQMACREEDLAEVGDTWVYDIANISILLVRSSKTEIKAFYNACLHRGVTLRTCPGRVAALKCPFHGFTWGLDGALRFIPSRENFPHIKTENFRLPEVKVGRWGGFVFINMDTNSESLESYMGEFGTHFERAPLDQRSKILHITKVFPANWKVVQEAFLENWHVLTVHPQYGASQGERCSRLDVWGNYSRGLIGSGTTSDYIRDTPSVQKVVESALGRWDDSPPGPQIPDGVTARAALNDIMRAQLQPLWGDKLDELSDSEVIDVAYYTLFPNFNPFGTLLPYVYTFRPFGDDHTRSIMEVILLVPTAENAPAPAAPKIRWLSETEDFATVPELGGMGPFLSQDSANLSQIMKGMRNNQRKHVVFAQHHELKIRHFYSLYTRWMALDSAASEQTPGLVK